jgi:hypothetical protein
MTDCESASQMIDINSHGTLDFELRLLPRARVSGGVR